MLIASFRTPSAAANFALRNDATSISGTSIVFIRSAGWTPGEAPVLAMQGGIVDRRRGRLLAPHDIAQRLATEGDQAMADWAPPFRLAWLQGETANVAADAGGMGHWFYWQGSGVAVIASTATAIARAFDLGVEREALGSLALTGMVIDDLSIVAGVRLLPLGTAGAIANGQFSSRHLPAASILSEPVDAVAAATTRLLDAHADAEVELTGGWDSRMVLAAIPRERRRGRLGLTLGSENSVDVILASRLAQDSAMHHDIIDPATFEVGDCGLIESLISVAAARDDYSSNPLDRALINSINAARPPHPRFSGQNGEILRGFYYPGQPLSGYPAVKRARSVINWRIISNDRVAANMFLPDWLEETTVTIVNRLTKLLTARNDDNWAAALDRFYFEQRMRRWCGAAVSATLGQRSILLPFFDADVINLAAKTGASEKANSRLAARLITRLDPAVASIMLENGMAPDAIAAGGLNARLGLVRKSAGTAVAKLRQRLGARGPDTLGSRGLLGLAIDHGVFKRLNFHNLSKLEIFSPAALDAIGKGTLIPSRTSGGFLLNCDQLLANVPAAT